MMRLYCNGKTTQNATWADVEAVLPELKNEAFFNLDIRPSPKNKPDSLEIQSENGNYLLAVSIEGGGVRHFYNQDGVGKEMVEIGGYDWNPALITQDFDLIVRMVKEFYETGNVAEELLPLHSGRKSLSGNISQAPCSDPDGGNPLARFFKNLLQR